MCLIDKVSKENSRLSELRSYIKTGSGEMTRSLVRKKSKKKIQEITKRNKARIEIKDGRGNKGCACLLM